MDNVFIERLWRSLKYECVYLHAFETGSELRAGLARWIGYYNARRPHSALAGRTPDEAYGTGEMKRLACSATIRMVASVNQDEGRRGQPEVGRSPAVG